MKREPFVSHQNVVDVSASPRNRAECLQANFCKQVADSTYNSLTVIQAFRQYASAAPTAAFAGQKGSNVSSLCILSEAADGRISRENIPSL